MTLKDLLDLPHDDVTLAQFRTMAAEFPELAKCNLWDFLRNALYPRPCPNCERHGRTVPNCKRCNGKGTVDWYTTTHPMNLLEGK